MSAITSTLRNGNSGTIRILIVDDHPIMRQGLKNLIRGESDLQVCAEAEGLSQALVAYRETNPNLVITDVTLQNGSGIELVKELVAQQPKIRILVCSMHDETLFAERALRAGAKGYINKAAAADQMMAAIRRVVDGRVYLSEGTTNRVLSRNTGNGKCDMLKSPVELLSDRELEVFEEIGRGATTRKVAEKLHLSPKTIETYRENIKAKHGFSNGSQLTRQAVLWVLEGCPR